MTSFTCVSTRLPQTQRSFSKTLLVANSSEKYDASVTNVCPSKADNISRGLETSAHRDSLHFDPVGCLHFLILRSQIVRLGQCHLLQNGLWPQPLGGVHLSQKSIHCPNWGPSLDSHGSWNLPSVDHTVLKLMAPSQPGNSGMRVEAENPVFNKKPK